jgi:Tfp pilus assembly protein PilO
MKSGSNRKVIAMLVGLVVVIAYLVVWRPHGAELADVETTRDAMTADLAVLNAAAVAPPPSIDAAVSTQVLDAAIPSTPELPNLLRQLQQIAGEAGVDQTTVSPALPASNVGAPGASIAITIAVAGPKLNVDDYVHRLSTLERLFVVDKLSVVASKSDTSTADPAAAVAGTFEVNISGRVFTLAAAGKAGSSG